MSVSLADCSLFLRNKKQACLVQGYVHHIELLDFDLEERLYFLFVYL